MVHRRFAIHTHLYRENTSMRISVPKELKPQENRVALTPGGVMSLRQDGHDVCIETGAGLGSMFTDEEYKAAGATILTDRAALWSRADMVLKVKEPEPEEFVHLREGLVLFTYLHLAADAKLTETLIASGIVGIAYETVQLPNGSLPLLAPMSEVAGRMAPQLAAIHLASHNGGKGILMGGVPGVDAARTLIIGGGVVGTNAAKVAMGLGARVTIIDSNLERLRYLDDIFGTRCQTLVSNSVIIAERVALADVVIGAVLVPGGKTPKLVTEDMVKTMRPGGVIVDVAVDQGGCIATIDHVTTHSNPTYVKHGIVHYAVGNMPGAVPRTSTFALTNATLPYVQQLANLGWKAACRKNHSLALGINIAEKTCVYDAVGAAFGLHVTPLQALLA